MKLKIVFKIIETKLKMSESPIKEFYKNKVSSFFNKLLIFRKNTFRIQDLDTYFVYIFPSIYKLDEMLDIACTIIK